MLGRHEVVDADDLALEKRPIAFDAVRVVGAIDVLARAMADHAMVEAAAKVAIAAVFVGRDLRARGDDGMGETVQRSRAGAVHHRCDDHTAALHGADHRRFARETAALAARIVLVLVHRLAADVGLVNLDLAVQRLVERLRTRRMAKTVEHKPRGLLRNAQVLGERGAGDTLFMRGDKPDRQHPRTERDFTVLKDGADLDREPLAAIAALVSAPVAKMVDLGRATLRAERAAGPADRSEMVNRRLLVGERLHHLEQRLELAKGGLRAHAAYIAPTLSWVKHVYRSRSGPG